ncbi:MAG: hypothetical protein GY751_12905 [Bacteroidetes bacterium]|nr:hypothetical protein [Bacteroidota bacterium]
MAKVKNKRYSQDLWGSYFGGLKKWGDQFLIRKNGPLISGICLDRTRDPEFYIPTFFYHNLLVQSSVVKLSYAAPLLSRGVPMALKYCESVEEFAAQLKTQVEALDEKQTFSKFVNHIAAARRGDFGPQAVYLPHALRDVILLGGFLGDKEYYESTIDDAAKIIIDTPNINLNMVGSIEEWKETITNLLRQNFNNAIEEHNSELSFPNLDDNEISYSRLKRYWEYIT